MDPRDEILTADYWTIWDRFAEIVDKIYTYESVDEIRTVIRSHGMRKLHRLAGRDGDRFGAVWRQAITVRDEAAIDAVATHLTDPDRPGGSDAIR